MSTQNKMLAQRFYDEVLGRKNLDVLDELCARDVVDHNPLPGQDPGLPGLRKVMAEYLGAFPDLRLTVTVVVADDDVVAARYEGEGTHAGTLMGAPATGKLVKFHGIDMLRIRGGKAVDVWHEGNDLAVMMELGVRAPA